MKLRIILALFALTLFTGSCKKDEKAVPQNTVFELWSVCGFCVPSDLVVTLAENGLFDEHNNQFPDSLFQEAQQVLVDEPAILCDSTTEAYGCARCLDGADYFIKKRCGAAERTWSFDPNDQSNPQEVRDFAWKLQNLYAKCYQY